MGRCQDRDDRRFARGRDLFDERHHGGGPFGGGGRRGRRVFDHGDLKLVILRLIANKPRHGYEVIKAVEEALGGQYAPSPGVVYPTLTLLEELGHAAAAAADGNRKLYGATEEGKAFLAANQGTVNAIFARMAEMKARHGDGPPPQIIRAMENLKTALRLKLAGTAPSEEQIRAAAAAIDAAALEIEKL
ncbi:PadR family transcriptional regulator [Zavarzinia compransoris]|uniref:PadR family transcriptional regulator n=2 Tax=Zavarzinia compransoris TaxID=1264899 RepID=A0A317E6I7_9PROT|nr:PadR family transcriptional regulator [Zavarzinia compransoris]